MGDFLNIISEDYELLNESHYYLRIYDQVIKNNTIKSKLRTVGVNNLNYCTLDEAILNKDKTYVYFLFKQSDYTYSDSKRYLDKKFINALRENNNIKLIYFIEDESIDFENFRLIDSYCEFENLNQRSVYVYNNNANMDFFIKKIGSKLNVFKSSFLPITYSKKFIDFNIEFKPDKKFLFLVQNKRLKNHRFATMCFLMKNNILSKTDWSFIENHMLGEFDFFKSIFLHNLLDDSSVYENEIKVLSNTILKKNHYETINNESKYIKDFINAETFLDSYINITTESHFIESDIHISEKSFKPFYFYQFPIIISTYGHVKKMRELYNYDFYDDIINHSYDAEIDPKKRLNMVFDEILRLSSIESEIINYYKSNVYRFEKNKMITQELKNINESKFFYNI
jgi:hypothetical protein